MTGPSSSELEVLLVDDDAFVLKSAARLLRRLGMAVTVAGDGREALALLGARRFALVISDRNMPGMSGWQLQERIAEQWPNTPVLLASGYAASALDASSKPLKGRVALIDKPLRAELLRESVAKILDSSGA